MAYINGNKILFSPSITIEGNTGISETTLTMSVGEKIYIRCQSVDVLYCEFGTEGIATSESVSSKERDIVAVAVGEVVADFKDSSGTAVARYYITVEPAPVTTSIIANGSAITIESAAVTEESENTISIGG